jgi:hypothetical protein
VVHWVEIGGNSQKWANNGPKMSQKWALDSVENFFVSEERRDFFQPSHTTTYSGPKTKNRAAAQWSTGWE